MTPNNRFAKDQVADFIDAVFAVHAAVNRKKIFRKSGVKEQEFLALELLESLGMTTVGNVQKLLGVLPAQMSRIVRKLELRERPLIQCSINTEDRRKINVELTTAGEKILRDIREGLIPIVGEWMKTAKIDDHEARTTHRTLTRVADAATDA